MKIIKAQSRIYDGQIIYDLVYKNGNLLCTYLPITRLPSFIVDYNVEFIDEGVVYYHDGKHEELLGFYNKAQKNIDALLNSVISECILDFSNYLNFIYNLRK
jgi:hypothetical protein